MKIGSLNKEATESVLEDEVKEELVLTIVLIPEEELPIEVEIRSWGVSLHEIRVE